MANISLKALFQQKQNEFGTDGTGSRRFTDDFLFSVNRAISRINRDADLETRISAVTSAEASVALDETYQDVLSDLVTIELRRVGQRLAAGAEIDVAELSKSMPDRIDSIRQDILNQAIAADEDDEEDFIGLGGLG